MNLNHIVTGWGNWFLDKINALPEARKRSAIMKSRICAPCPLKTNNSCDPKKTGPAVRDFHYEGRMRKKGVMYNGCGCGLDQKLLSDSSCPLGKF